MIRVLLQPRPFGINANIVLFSAYAILGIVSFVLPSSMRLSWFFVLHAATLIVNIDVVYGLATMRRTIHFLVAVISSLMAVHLFSFLFVPLGMLFAYIGPSRAFHGGLLAIAMRSGDEKGVTAVLAVFNLAMLLIHIVNACYFIKMAKAGTIAKYFGCFISCCVSDVCFQGTKDFSARDGLSEESSKMFEVNDNPWKSLEKS